MSVRTQSDDELQTAKDAVNTAVVSLSKIVIEKVEGTDDFRAVYFEMLKDSLFKLIDIREKLGE